MPSKNSICEWLRLFSLFLHNLQLVAFLQNQHQSLIKGFAAATEQQTTLINDQDILPTFSGLEHSPTAASTPFQSQSGGQLGGQLGTGQSTTSSLTSPQDPHHIGGTHPHAPFLVQPSISSTTGSLGAPEPKSALKQKLGRSLDEPNSHMSSSSRSDSVSSGSDTKRFLVAKDQGHGLGHSLGSGEGGWGDEGGKKGAELSSHGQFARKVGDIQNWWGELADGNDEQDIMQQGPS